MAVFRNISTFSNIAKLLLNKPLNKNVPDAARNYIQTTLFTRHISKSACLNDLMEFFDHKDNWGLDEVKSGRSWNKDELRLKANEDLHKLWYILLKERNMLLTMEKECNDQVRVFPSPERIDKVEESMENLETVVRERNEAYYLLETGETGERKTVETTSPFGLPTTYREQEHIIPKFMNAKWHKEHTYDVNKKDVVEFVRKYKEKQKTLERRKNTRDFNHVIGLLKRFPNMDMEAVREQYPNVDIEKAKNSRKCRGHFVPK